MTVIRFSGIIGVELQSGHMRMGEDSFETDCHVTAMTHTPTPTPMLSMSCSQSQSQFTGSGHTKCMPVASAARERGSNSRLAAVTQDAPLHAVLNHRTLLIGM
eukprot:366197-Chlamydomonas_euryale.AAC.8